jgi:Dynactin complex subunit involved in mitotic spindle partitioning in anaphase B
VGILRYYGEINLTSGLFCGVELDEPAGLNDGSVQGVRYFTCRPQHGIIAPVGIVRPLPQQPPDIGLKTSVNFSLDESGPFSLLDDITMEQMEDHLQTHVSIETHLSVIFCEHRIPSGQLVLWSQKFNRIWIVEGKIYDQKIHLTIISM